MGVKGFVETGRHRAFIVEQARESCNSIKYTFRLCVLRCNRMADVLVKGLKVSDTRSSSACLGDRMVCYIEVDEAQCANARLIW